MLGSFWKIDLRKAFLLCHTFAWLSIDLLSLYGPYFPHSKPTVLAIPWVPWNHCISTKWSDGLVSEADKVDGKLGTGLLLKMGETLVWGCISIDHCIEIYSCVGITFEVLHQYKCSVGSWSLRLRQMYSVQWKRFGLVMLVTLKLVKIVFVQGRVVWSSAPEKSQVSYWTKNQLLFCRKGQVCRPCCCKGTLESAWAMPEATYETWKWERPVSVPCRCLAWKWVIEGTRANVCKLGLIHQTKIQLQIPPSVCEWTDLVPRQSVRY